MQVTFSPERAQIFAALANAQSEMDGAAKDSNNPFFRSRYVSLTAVLDAILPCMNRHGLSLLQHPGYDDETSTVTVTTVVAHSSGEFMMSVVGAPIPSEASVLAHLAQDPKDKKGLPKRDAQAVGSAITYLRRYAAQAIMSLPVDDDDGEAAARRERTPPAPAPAPKVGPVGSAVHTPKPAPAPAPDLGRALKAGESAIEAITSIRNEMQRSGLSVADLNVWLSKRSKPPVDAMNVEALGKCLTWLREGGAETVATSLVGQRR